MPTVPTLPSPLYAIGPPYRNDQLDTWWVSSFPGVMQVLTDERLSAEYVTDADRERHTPLMSGPQAADGNRHRRLRGAIGGRFAPAAADALRPIITGIADDLAEQLSASTGPVDLVTAFARPLPAQVICAILDVGGDVAARVWGWIEAELFTSPATTAIPPQAEQWAFWHQVVAERRAKPGGGLLDELLANPALDDHDVIGLVTILMHAGMATTAAALTTAVAELDAGGFLKDGLDPEQLPAVVRETLRVDPPFPFVRRRARSELEIDGQLIRADEWVTGSIAAAHRDPTRWPDPQEFRLDRPGGIDDLAFGGGVHRCLGVHLAKVELEAGLQALLDVNGLRVDPTAALARYWPSYLPMIKALPVLVGS
jgi:cytochrome P450